jgi:putative flippase GtrA
MRTLLDLLSDRSLIRFVVTGLLNTVVGLGVIYALKLWLTMADTPANFIGYTAGLVFSYQLNSRWTFGYRQSVLAALPKYMAVMLCAYLANLLCLHAVLTFEINSYLAQALTVVPYAVVGYLGMRFWVFRNAPKNRLTLN